LVTLCALALTLCAFLLTLLPILLALLGLRLLVLVLAGILPAVLVLVLVRVAVVIKARHERPKVAPEALSPARCFACGFRGTQPFTRNVLQAGRRLLILFVRDCAETHDVLVDILIHDINRNPLALLLRSSGSSSLLLRSAYNNRVRGRRRVLISLILLVRTIASIRIPISSDDVCRRDCAFPLGKPTALQRTLVQLLLARVRLQLEGGAGTEGAGDAELAQFWVVGDGGEGAGGGGS
jgi:hypothetical protein